MAILQRIVLVSLLSILTTGCCLINYSSDLQILGDKLKSKINDFYIQKNRIPTYAERDEIILSLGCKLARVSPVPVYNCSGNGYEINASFHESPNTVVSLRLVRSKTVCRYRYRLGDNGNETASDQECFQTHCLDLKQ